LTFALGKRMEAPASRNDYELSDSPEMEDFSVNEFVQEWKRVVQG